MVSNYTRMKYKVHNTRCNETKKSNLINRQFDGNPQYHAIVSDLTYVRVGSSWNYICILLDLFNRQIIGYSSGKNKNADLVKRAFASVKFDLSKIHIFHTDDGNEFDNILITDISTAFGINHSLSMKGCPYDNAVAESTFHILKTEFINNYSFSSLHDLSLQPHDYVNWFNFHRIHSSLGYLSPIQFLRNNLIFSV